MGTCYKKWCSHNKNIAGAYFRCPICNPKTKVPHFNSMDPITAGKVNDILDHFDKKLDEILERTQSQRAETS